MRDLEYKTDSNQIEGRVVRQDVGGGEVWGGVARYRYYTKCTLSLVNSCLVVAV